MNNVIIENLFSNIISSNVLLRKLLEGVQLLRQWKNRNMFSTFIYSEAQQLMAGRTQGYTSVVKSDLVIIDGTVDVDEIECDILVVAPGTNLTVHKSLVVKHAGLIYGCKLHLASASISLNKSFIKDVTTDAPLIGDSVKDDRASDIEDAEIRTFIRVAYLTCFGSRQVEVAMLHDDELEDLDRIPVSLVRSILQLHSKEPGLTDLPKRDTMSKIITLSYCNPRVREDLRCLIEDFRAQKFSAIDPMFGTTGVVRTHLTKGAAEALMFKQLKAGRTDQQISQALLIDVSVVAKYRKRYNRALQISA